jgi:hypothetical protein
LSLILAGGGTPTVGVIAAGVWWLIAHGRLPIAFRKIRVRRHQNSRAARFWRGSERGIVDGNRLAV